MKAYSSSFTVVQFIFQRNEKFPGYDALNGHRYSKNNKKVEYLIGHLWETIQAVRVIFLQDTYDHLGYQHTKFCPILRGLCAKLCNISRSEIFAISEEYSGISPKHIIHGGM